MKKCFVAYPSDPLYLAETIEKAIESIRNGYVVDIEGWKSLSVTGKFIIDEICKAIDNSDIFICDLTNLNHNVLFELGYAIARNKIIWILLDPNIEKAKQNYEKFQFLTTVGYTPYSNSKDIEIKFYEEKPWENIENTIYKTKIESLLQNKNETILYVKSIIETESSIKLSQQINSLKIETIIDDPNEVKTQTLPWYAKAANRALGVIVHFISSDHIGWKIHNAKNSFVSGLAFGFGKKLLMLAHAPYQSPIDYKDLLVIHDTAKKCEDAARTWLNEIENEFFEREESTKEFQKEIKAQSELQSINIGDPVAEHEVDTLSEYFIETAAYNTAIKSKHSLFVARKGYGKTAILYKLADEVASDPRNHICIIKPIAYELDGIIQMLKKTLESSEKGYLIESFWKFLIYTEITKSLIIKLQEKPSYHQYSEEEEKLLAIVEKYESIILPDFSIRLETIVSNLNSMNVKKSKKDQRASISELLHSDIISKIRIYAGSVLEKKNKVHVLIDNLDKAWKQGADFSILSELLLSLISVSRRITNEFRKEDHKRKHVNLNLTIFLRSDIFSQIVKFAREKDKISLNRIIWDDPELLLRVIEERILSSTDSLSPKEIWVKYFCSDIRGVTTKQYLTENILPRPRDIIYLCRIAFENAINRRHAKITEKDMIDAQKNYSQYVLDSLLVENSIQIELLESFLYEFVGAPEIIDRDFIINAAKNSKIEGNKHDDVIELLCDLTFLGVEVSDGRFEFLFDKDQKEKLNALARKLAEGRKTKSLNFRIHPAFHSYLEIKKHSRY